MARADWVRWHERYADPESLPSRRLPIVQAHIRAFLDSRAGEDLRVISLCAGDGRDLLDVLETSPQLGRVSARLVELNPQLAARARERVARLPRVEMVEGDAGVTDAYEGFAAADLVLACGVFGNVPDDDVENTVRALPQLCAEGGEVIWTRHRRSPDLTPSIRRWFAEAGFREQAFDSPRPDSFAVGVHRSARPPLPLQRGQRLFTFFI